MILPYTTMIGGGVTTSYLVGKKTAKEGGFNTGASLTVAGVSTTSSVAANSYMDARYQDVLDKYHNETSSTYVEQLSDAELEKALIEFDLLESDEKENVKML